jgi:hypothetical protein
MNSNLRQIDSKRRNVSPHMVFEGFEPTQVEFTHTTAYAGNDPVPSIP